MPPKSVNATLQQALLVLGGLGVRCAVMGGIAAGSWGRLRSTKDVDLLIAARGAEVEQLVAAFQRAGFSHRRSDPLVKAGAAEFVQLFFEPADSFIEVRVDLMLANSPYLLQVLDRTETIADPDTGIEFDVVSCEDLVLLKLSAGRIIDRADAAGLLRDNRDELDVTYLTERARDLGVKSELAEAWEEAFPGESGPR